MMKTKIVYCLVSDNKDYYYEQLLISLCSLRKHNPDANVEIICDYDTFYTLEGNRREIYEYNVKVAPVETPKDWGKKERSRFLKTNLRNLVAGDFLFIDTDTIICTKLDEIDDYDCAVGAVLDSHLDHPIPSIPKHDTELWICDNAKKVGVNIEDLTHFNSGVFYVKDCPEAHHLYKLWNELYKELRLKGSTIDQLPLMLSNKRLNGIITKIPPMMNCQVIWEKGKDILKDAKIIHYFPQQKHFVLSSPWLLDPIKETGKLPNTIKNIIDNPFDFFRRDSSIVYGEAIGLIKSPMMEIYTSCNNLFRVLEFIAVNYLRLKVFAWRMIHLKF